MLHTLAAALALVCPASPTPAGLTGQYVEARTCEVWTGPCFANADFNLTGKNALMAWRVQAGTFEGVRLDGLSVVAVVSAPNTIGLEQSGPAKAILIVDQRANSLQRNALVKFAQKQAGQLLANVVGIQSANVQVTLCACDGETCAEVIAGRAKVKTRCINHKEDKACGNESAFYPPLAQGVNARVAGFVLNGAELDSSDFRYYYSYHSQHQTKSLGERR